MNPYFAKMNNFGKELKQGRKKRAAENVDKLKEVEAGINEQVNAVH